MRVFVHPNGVHSDFISPFSNSLPWSLCITRGIPNRSMILSTSISATVSGGGDTHLGYGILGGKKSGIWDMSAKKSGIWDMGKSSGIWDIGVEIINF